MKAPPPHHRYQDINIHKTDMEKMFASVFNKIN
jgi:hypothetical protein